MVLLSRLCKSDEQLPGVISLYLHNTYSYTTLQQHNTWIQRYLCMHSLCTFFHLFLYVFIFWLRKNMKIQGVPQLSSHFVLHFFSAYRTHTEVHLTIFQQPRRRRFQKLTLLSSLRQKLIKLQSKMWGKLDLDIIILVHTTRFI